MKNETAKGSKLPYATIPEIIERRPFAVRALTVLLFIQACAFILIGFFNTEWNLPFPQLVLGYATELAYLVMGLINLIGAIGFLRLRPAAWLMAMAVQGIFLTLALITYVVIRPDDDRYTFYGLMALSVLIVIYLNYAEVPALFLRWRAPNSSSYMAGSRPDFYEDYSGRDY